MTRLMETTVVSLLCLAIAGCGSDGPALGTVTGQVTMDGKPLPNVAVTFIPVGGGGTATGQTDANGNYKLHYFDREGAPLGQHKVSLTTVQQPQTTVAEMSSDSPEYQKYLSEADNYNVKFTEPIPAKYNAQTTLEKEVTSGANVINLELSSM